MTSTQMIQVKLSEYYPTDTELNNLSIEEIKYDIKFKNETKSKVIYFGYAVKDFNIDGTESPIKLFLDENDNWNENLSEINIPFLSFFAGELLLFTIKQNEDGWIEGYRASDKSKLIGITHIDFVHIYQ